ncbi:right-handed parallel beta-helix repeat-containing protein [Cellulosimicrobium terreum]|nr:right-handed parallel beta-helix repeat-containing protein [Cellulosimicrobium terreum]
MRRPPRLAAPALALVVACVGVLAACTGESGADAADTLTVSAGASIQDAVDRVAEGGTVEVEPGTYEESVQVTTPGVTLRGTDRDGVVIDGGGLRPNGVVVTAPGVSVENLTVRNHTLNGVLVTGLADETGGLARGSDGYTRLDPDANPPLQGFAVRYVTASNNGLYGVYAFDAQDGVVEQSYASGHADSGFYVGQCQECRIVVRDNVAEANAVGYEQTNASAPVVVTGNRFAGNRVGAALMSDYQEAFVPQRGTTFAGNVVSGNANPDTPAQADGAFGLGVVVSGGQDDVLARNRVGQNPLAGVLIGSVEDVAPDGNRVEGNVLDGNGVDLAYTASERAPGAGLCAVGNELATTSPDGLLDGWSCDDGGSTRAAGVALTGEAAPPGISFRDVAPPPAQPSVPDAAGPAGPDAPVWSAPGWTDRQWQEVEALADAAEVPAADLLADRGRA